MFIILEGTDASGKSTLVDAVRKAVHARQPNTSTMEVHHGKPSELTRESVLFDYVLDFQSNPHPHYNIVADRWHWGEVTYAPVKRPETNLDGYGLLGKAGWRWVELFLASRGAAIFWINQPLDVVKARLAVRGDDYVNEGELDSIYRLYHTAVEDTLSLAGILSPEADSLDAVPDLANFIAGRALFEETNAHFLCEYPEYIGVVKPKVLFVTTDKSEISRTPLPLMPLPDSQGEFFLDSLPGYTWENIGIIRIDESTAHTLPNLVNKLGRPKIISLGTDADNELLKHFPKHRIANMCFEPREVKNAWMDKFEGYQKELNRLIEDTDYMGDDRWRF